MVLRLPALDAEPTAPQVPVAPRAPQRAQPVGRRTDPSVAEAVHLVGRRGYVRMVEPAGADLWCPSCASRFEPATLLVGAVMVADGGTVIALRDPATGAGVVWVVRDWTEEERQLMRRLQWRPLARRRRPSRQARPRRAAEAVA